MIKFETVLEEEKVVKIEKSAERLGQRREGVITTNISKKILRGLILVSPNVPTAPTARCWRQLANIRHSQQLLAPVSEHKAQPVAIGTSQRT